MSRQAISFFDEQFRRQGGAGEPELNPFERAALPWLHGEVLDYGCGLGALALAAARRGCRVRAMDGSAAAIDRLRARALAEGLAIDVVQADLRGCRLAESFDAVVSIGLLMFFDCATAQRQLGVLKEAVRPGGFAAINVLTQGTSFLDLFGGGERCLFAPGELAAGFAGWEQLLDEDSEFPAPQGTRKLFSTVIARRPAGGTSHEQ
jgi:tellurite methyltransferase